MEILPLSGARSERAAALARQLDGLYVGSAHPAPLVGGRREGLLHLRVFPVEGYAATRNTVGEGSGVSRLSPYIRHGCLSLREARAHGVERIGAVRATKWIQELAWRQFWRLVHTRLGERIQSDLEDPKVCVGKNSAVPEEILTARTNLRCMDESLRQLYETGYMENHARMWFAAYFVHFLKLDWRAGAALFYRFLLDGDHASNSLSWQWIASTFSHKPYYFNRQNVEKYSNFCQKCPAATNKTCPFEGSYETLGKKLFGKDFEGR